MPKYVDMSAKLEIKAEDLFQLSVNQMEPPKDGIFIIQDGKISWKAIEKPAKK